MSFDHILVIGFGGPLKREEIKPFVEGVTKGAHIPEARLREVESHYEKIGGFSPYHQYTLQLVKKLGARLHELKISLPLLLGMRNWHPFLKDTLTEIDKMGLEDGIGIVLAPHRSDASFWKYLRSVEDAREAAQAKNIHYEYLKPWFDHPLFIEAQADQVRKILNSLSPEERKETHLLFTAHSIPIAMASECHYTQEFQKSSELVVGELNHPKWSIAYQSRSGNPSGPWLEPDVISAIKKLGTTPSPISSPPRRGRGERSSFPSPFGRGEGEGENQFVLLIPIGFLCDNAEVLYDLDIEARRAAEEIGLKYVRAQTVTDHPTFVEMLAELIEEKLSES